MTNKDKIAAGSDGQVILKTVITDEDDVVISKDVEYFDTVAEAEIAKAAWDD